MCSLYIGTKRRNNAAVQPIRLSIARYILLSCLLVTSLSHLRWNPVLALHVGPTSTYYRNGVRPVSGAFLHWKTPHLDHASLVKPNTGRLSHLTRNYTQRTNSDIPLRGQHITALGLFGTISNWFSNKFKTRWFVPPMPTGTLASTILRKKGPLQTEEETKRFFDTIGVSSDASLPEISEAYEHAVHTLPSDMHKVLEESFDEFLRKQFVQAFEHMESFMERGQRGWEEYWDPTKDAFGNPVNMTSEAAELKDQIIADRMPPELDVTKFREYWKKNNTRFSTMLQEINMPSRLRLTSNFGGRLARASIFMLPVMLLGLFPQYSSLSLGIQGLLASGFIFKGDREIILKREQESSTSIATAEPIARSTSSRTLVTSLVLCVHSLIGIGAAKLFGYYTSILEYLPEQLLRVASINLQFFIAALLWDTSDITQSTYVKQEEKRMSKLTKYLPKDIPEI